MEKMKKVKCFEGLNQKLKSEQGFLLFYLGGYELLPVIDFEDFYSYFKQYVEKVENQILDDNIHKNKIRYYIDQTQNNQITPEIVCDFFDLCWNNPKDYNLIISDKAFEWDDLDGANKFLKLQILQLSQKAINDNWEFQEQENIIIDPKGYQNGPNYRNGIVRIGRKAKSQPIVNDIYTSSKDTSISRRQLMFSYNKLAGYRLCCTSTSSTTDILLNNDQSEELYIGKFFKISEKNNLQILDSNQQQLLDLEEIYDQGKNQKNTIQIRKFNKQALKQKPENYEELTQKMAIQRQQTQNTEQLFEKGMDKIRQQEVEEQKQENQSDSIQLKSTKKINQGQQLISQFGQNQEEEPENETVNFKEQVQIDQQNQKLNLNPLFGKYINQWIHIEIFNLHIGKNEKFTIRCYDKKNIFSFGKSESCDYCLDFLNFDIQFYIFYENDKWQIKNGTTLTIKDPATYLSVPLKTFQQFIDHQPSKNTKVKNNTILKLPGQNIFKIEFIEEQEADRLFKEQDTLIKIRQQKLSSIPVSNQQKFGFISQQTMME